MSLIAGLARVIKDPLSETDVELSSEGFPSTLCIMNGHSEGVVT